MIKVYNFFALVLFFSLIVHCTSMVNNCMCQWQPDVRLTNASDSSLTPYNNARGIASNGNLVHIVWNDKRDGNMEIYYKRSSDGGINWGTDIRLTNDSAISIRPSVSVSGQFVHVVWMDTRDGYYKIYYKCSTDGGTNWAIDKRLSTAPFASSYPSVSVAGQLVLVVWQDFRDGNPEIFCKYSTDGGIEWGNDILVTPSYSSQPSVFISSQNVNVVWNDTRGGKTEIYYISSSDGGINWGTESRLTNHTTGFASYPNVAASGQFVNVVWQDTRDGNYEIYYNCSTDGGINWAADMRLTNNSGTSFQPSLAVSGLDIHVVFNDNRDGNNEIYYKHSSNNGINWDADTRLTNNSLYSIYPSISISGTTLNIIWSDNRDGNYEIYYKRNPTGNVGIHNINSGIPNKFDLSQNYPNPFNPKTKIDFEFPLDGRITLKVYDITGHEIAVLLNNEFKTANYYTIDFDGSNLASGIYFYRLQSENFMNVKRMVLIK